MNTNNISLQQVVNSAKLLSTRDKVKLIEQVTNQLDKELKTTPVKQSKSLRGLWHSFYVSDDDISEIRKDMWRNFPREDM